MTLVLVTLVTVLSLTVLVLAVYAFNLHKRLKAIEAAKRKVPDSLPWTEKCMAVGHRPHSRPSVSDAK